jgi:hypothetical protein
MMEQADILTPLLPVTEHGETFNVSTVTRAYFMTGGWTNIVGDTVSYPADPNNHVVRVKTDTATMDLIALDPNYTILEGTRLPV